MEKLRNIITEHDLRLGNISNASEIGFPTAPVSANCSMFYQGYTDF